MPRLPFFTAILVATSGCQIVTGSGVPATESYSFESFSRVHVANFVDVVITTTATGESGELTCDDNLLEFIEVAVSGDQLTVRTVPVTTSLNTRIGCDLSLFVDSLEEVSTSGSGDLSSTSDLEGITMLSTSGSGDIDLSIAGGADVTARVTGSGGITVDDLRVTDTLTASSSSSGDLALDGIDAATVTLSTSGSGSILAVGDTTEVDVTVSGSGDIDAASLQAVDADVRLSGSGSADIRASGQVQGSISGSGDLIVRGGADVDVRTTGSGIVDER